MSGGMAAVASVPSRGTNRESTTTRLAESRATPPWVMRISPAFASARVRPTYPNHRPHRAYRAGPVPRAQAALGAGGGEQPETSRSGSMGGAQFDEMARVDPSRFAMSKASRRGGIGHMLKLKGKLPLQLRRWCSACGIYASSNCDERPPREAAAVKRRRTAARPTQRRASTTRPSGDERRRRVSAPAEWAVPSRSGGGPLDANRSCSFPAERRCPH